MQSQISVQLQKILPDISVTQKQSPLLPPKQDHQIQQPLTHKLPSPVIPTKNAIPELKMTPKPLPSPQPLASPHIPTPKHSPLVIPGPLTPTAAPIAQQENLPKSIKLTEEDLSVKPTTRLQKQLSQSVATKSSAKSPRQSAESIPKMKTTNNKKSSGGLKSVQNTGRGGRSGRGRGRGRCVNNAIHRKLAGTVYDLDFEDDEDEVYVFIKLLEMINF